MRKSLNKDYLYKGSIWHFVLVDIIKVGTVDWESVNYLVVACKNKNNQ